MANISINMDALRDGGKEWKRFKVESGDNIYRILPPFGDPETHRGYPFKAWATIWLLDPETGKRRPYASQANPETCPVIAYTKGLEKHLENLAFQLKSATDPKEQQELAHRIKAVRSEQWKLKLSYTYAYNACNKAGEVGILEIKSTAHKDMKKKMNEYIKDYAQDPTSLNSEDDDSGVWFNIIREGTGTSTVYSVEFNQLKTKSGGRIVKEDDRSALPANVVANYDSLGYDLQSVYKTPSISELKSLLDNHVKLTAEHGNQKYDAIPDLVFDKVEEADDVPFEVDEPVAVSQSTKTKGKKPVALNLEESEDDVSGLIDDLLSN